MTIRCEDSLLKHPSRKDLKHSTTFLHPLRFGHDLLVFVIVLIDFVVAAARRVSRALETLENRNDLLVFVVFVVLAILRPFVTLNLDNTLGLLSLNTLVGQLLHHFQEFLSIVLEQIVGDREDTTYASRTRSVLLLRGSQRKANL